MPPTFKQLELDLWGDLKTALKSPEAVDMNLLWQGLEDAIAQARTQGFAHHDTNEQLLVAGNAIAQIVEVYVKRAKGILDSLEVIDSNDGPVLDEDFLSGLMRQSMTLDLSDLMEEFTFDDVESSLVSIGSQIAVVDRKEARAIARKARATMRKALKELAEQENIPQWQSAIAQARTQGFASWMQQHSEQAFSLLELQQALEMPLIEIWLGLLLGEQEQYKWETSGDFYNDAQDICLFT